MEHSLGPSGSSESNSCPKGLLPKDDKRGFHSLQEVERSDGSRQKLLNPLTKEGSSALPKFSSISLGQQKFTPEDLIVETIANSEKARRSLARS